MEEFFARLFYPDGDDKGRRLDESLLEVQEKYKAWFDESIGQDEDPNKRSILYYRTMYITSEFVQFKLDVPNMPKIIEQECIHKFNEIYG